MPDTAVCKNRINVTGRIISDISFSHCIKSECFFMSYLFVPRKSGRADILPLIFSERIIDFNRDYTGSFCRISGQFRSYRCSESCYSMPTFIILADKVTLLHDKDSPEVLNEIYLSGVISRPVIYRTTPSGRKIADVFLTVRRPHGKILDHIPCIAWDRKAMILSSAEPSVYIDVWGHLQSRRYIKHTKDEPPQKHMAYEVSIYRFKFIKDA